MLNIRLDKDSNWTGSSTSFDDATASQELLTSKLLSENRKHGRNHQTENIKIQENKIQKKKTIPKLKIQIPQEPVPPTDEPQK